jgi:cell division protein FtsQ
MRLRPFLRKLRSNAAGWTRLVALAVAVVVAVAGGAYGSYRHAWPSVVAHPYFRLKSVRVTCDTHTASAESLASRAGLYEGTSLWTVDPAEAASRLEAEPWVRDVRVERRFPDHVSVSVSRRTPVAATISDQGPFLIDQNGVVYREEGPLRYPDVPYVTGWHELGSRSAQITTLKHLLDLLEAVEGEGVRVSELHVDGDGEFWVYPDGRSFAVRVGEFEEPGEKARTLRRTLAQLPEDTQSIDEIDLSYPDRAILRTRSGSMDRVLAMLAGRESEADGIGGTGAARARERNDRG